MHAQEVGVLATTWDMYDTYEAINQVHEEQSQGGYLLVIILISETFE